GRLQRLVTLLRYGTGVRQHADRRTKVNRRGVLLFLLFLSAILYLSLYPVRPGYPPMPTELRWAPLFDRGQWIHFILNVAIYIPLGAAAFFALRAKAPA